MTKLFKISAIASSLIAVVLFFFSCVVMLTDGQGAIIFIFTLPVMAALLYASYWSGKKVLSTRLQRLPKVVGTFFGLFFISSFIPGVNMLPGAFLIGVDRAFTFVSGKTPRAFFQDRASFPNKLSGALEDNRTVSFAKLDVTFAWDRVCVFGPYTNNAKARSVLNLDWNIEEHSQIHFSDSINALVFMFEGKVNKVVDLRRGIADFKEVDICLERQNTTFEASTDANGLRKLSILK